MWFVDPITVKVPHDNRASFASTQHEVDLAAQRGECERAQLWGYDDTIARTNVKLSFSELTLDLVSRDSTADVANSGSTSATAPRAHASLPSSVWSYKQQGYVTTAQIQSLACS